MECEMEIECGVKGCVSVKWSGSDWGITDNRCQAGHSFDAAILLPPNNGEEDRNLCCIADNNVQQYNLSVSSMVGNAGTIAQVFNEADCGDVCEMIFEVATAAAQNPSDPNRVRRLVVRAEQMLQHWPAEAGGVNAGETDARIAELNTAQRQNARASVQQVADQKALLRDLADPPEN